MPTGWIEDDDGMSSGRDDGDNDRECPADCRFIKGEVKLVMQPSDEVRQVLANHAIDIENRSILNGTGQGRPMLGIQIPRRSWRFAVQQAVRFLSTEPQHPVADRLKADTAMPGRFGTRSTNTDERKGAKTPDLFCVLGHGPAYITLMCKTFCRSV